MKRAPSIASFVAQPIDRWVVAGSAIVWCKNASLGGAVAWGRPTPSETREITSAFAALFGPTVAREVDVVLDGRGIDFIASESMEALIGWLSENRSRFVERVRLQIGVIPDGLLGVTLAGILPAQRSEHHPFRVERDSLAALRILAPDNAAEIADELASLVAEASGISPLIRRLRASMEERGYDLTVDDAARALGVSTRTLQRSLKSEDTSFQDELREARVFRAAFLLRSTDEKIAAVPARVAVNEGTLSELVRDRFGATPAEYRRSFENR